MGRGDSKPQPLCPPPTPRTATSALQNKWVFLAAFAAVLGNFSFGYALVYTSPVIPALERSLDPSLRLTKTQASWFGVRAALGARGGGAGGGGTPWALSPARDPPNTQP